MKYMLLIYLQEHSLTEDEREACYAESARLVEQLQERGEFLAASPLHPTSLATTVRLREGRRLVTDGPFAETREQLGGYYLVDVRDLDRALDIAACIPMARKGSVEVRPVIELRDRPADQAQSQA